MFYVSTDDGSVAIPPSLDPYKQLGISTSTSAVDTKKVLRREISQSSRRARALASLAYHMITARDEQRYSKESSKEGTLFVIHNPDIFTYAAVGHTKAILAEISKDPKLLNSVDELERTLLYHTARSGFYDTTKALLKEGALIDQQQADNSTPLHAAAFYGQSLIVKLLLVHGADPSIKNNHDSTPVDESSPEIKQIFEDYKHDPMSVIMSILTMTGLVEDEVRLISYNGEVIAREVLRNKKLLRKSTHYQWERICQQWKLAFHGTRFDCIESILKHGILKSGSKTPLGEQIKPPRHHFQLSETIAGVQNWAAAVFVSPSILYASHGCYSDRITVGDSKWCVVVKVLIEPSCYRTSVSTVTLSKPSLEGEPDKKEYRCRETKMFGELHKEWEKRCMPFTKSHEEESETARNVVVRSVLFVDLNFLENVQLSHEEVCQLFSRR